MATNYKILGQGVNSLKIDAPANGSTIISELKIKNTSYPTNVDIMCSDKEIFKIIGLDTSFNPNANTNVLSIALQPDGKILVGGDFTTIGGEARSRIARLNSDGTVDTDFDPNIDSNPGSVFEIALQPDGKILVGGSFFTIGGVTRNNIARLNSDGTLDTSFNPNANASVSSIALQPDGKIIIGGVFTTIGGVARSRIARLNSDGTVDTDFAPSANGTVRFVALQLDGEILIGGNFTNINGEARSRIAKINSSGTLDTGFVFSLDDQVNSIALQPDGKILVGGNFTTIGGGVTRNRIFRLNSDNTLDTSFDPNVGSNVDSIALQPDGKIFLGGFFTTIGGVTRNRIARLNSDGTLDTSFNPNANGSVLSTVLQPDGKIIIGGIFTTIGGVARNRIARLEENVISADHFISENKSYIIKNKSLSYDEEIKISGGIALHSGQSLAIETRNYDPGTVIIQAYGIEETP
jgi:uncharacterized delta-60 repeat protein